MAFAQWGGEFWVFTSYVNTDKHVDCGSIGYDAEWGVRVGEYDWSSGSIVGTNDFFVGSKSPPVGAGVSTCAPTKKIPIR